jgi:tRNA dimethylallyltransferase
MKPPLLIVAGPTGVGKTATAVALAERIPIEVVSADSRQVYRYMDVATGKPSLDERRAVVHHLLDVVDPDDPYHAARFGGDAARILAEIRGRGRLPVVVGGTGLYIRGLLRGLDPAPPADPGFRRELERVAVRDGRGALHERLRGQAPAMARRLHPNDHVRVIRALERVRGGVLGEEPGRWRTGCSAYRALSIGLTMARPRLHARLRQRARAMVAAGLAGEVEMLLARGYDHALPALRGIGYRQFVEVAAGRLGPEEALASMVRETVQYARRQWTWFTREPDIRWLDVETAGGPVGAARSIQAMLEEGGFIE